MTLPQEPRRVPSTLGGMVYLVVVAASVVGLVVVALGPWRQGVGLIGIALLLAALMRAVLREHDAGMLRVRRHRWVDVLMLGGVGASLILLAALIPNQAS